MSRALAPPAAGVTTSSISAPTATGTSTLVTLNSVRRPAPASAYGQTEVMIARVSRAGDQDGSTRSRISPRGAAGASNRPQLRSAGPPGAVSVVIDVGVVVVEATHAALPV